MTKITKEHKKHYKVSSRPILNLLVGLGFFTVILVLTMMSAAKDNGYQGSPNTTNSQDNNQAISEEDTSNGDILAVVKAIDADNKIISLYDVNHQKTLDLYYTGGTNITDKYGSIIAISQIEIGSMVDASYQEDKNKLTDMNLSAMAWEYKGVNNFTIDPEAKVMKIAKTKYKYDEDVMVINEEEFVPISTLTEQDELIVRGFEETIWSISVTRGHGTVVLEDYKAFLGSFITIGYEAIQQITENMEIAVREGNFNLTVETGDYSATKNITVYRDKITYVSLSDLGPIALQHGRVVFEITPFGADLYIDGELTSYANALDFDYGDYTIKVSMGGYTTYNGELTVDSAGKTIKIDLPESSSQDTVTVTETQDSTNAETDTETDTGTNTGTETENDTDTSGSEGTQTSEDTDPNDNIDTEHLIYVQKPAGASVYIDGKFKCIAPGNFLKVTGSHVITFIQEGYQTQSYTIEVADDNLDTYFTFPDLTKE